MVRVDDSGYPELSVVVMDLTNTGAGVGTFSVLSAQNTNDPNTSPSYEDFASQGTGNYCINADNTTGYLGAISVGGCPVAIAFAGANGVAYAQFRGINSTENRVQATTCRAQ
jgi:hypothetical protein